MEEINKFLEEKKKVYDNIKIPNELEARLSNALIGKERKRNKRFNFDKRLIAACLILFLIAFNFNTLAYYSKRLIGYDQIMNTTLKNLNELGKGQIIDESYTFKNGVIFTLDGIMVDDNQFLAFYTVTDPSGENDFISLNPRLELRGLFKRYFQGGGSGELLEDSNEVKWIMSFESPAFYERTLDLEIYLAIDGVGEQGKISFRLDRSKAMKSTLRQSINKTLEYNGINVHFKSIIASPTSTVIDGSIQNILELALDHISGERMRPNNLELKLIANGREVEKRGGSMRTDLKGITFSREFDALPSNLERLQIHLESFSLDKDVSKIIDISKDTSDYVLEIEEQVIEINELTELGGNTYITFTSDDSVVLTKVFLIIDGEKISLKETINSEYDKHMDGKITHKRTMVFNGVGLNYQLVIEKMTFSERYDGVIDIL